MRLTLLVPELIWPEPNDQLTLGKLSLPGFEWLAARAGFAGHVEGDLRLQQLVHVEEVVVLGRVEAAQVGIELVEQGHDLGLVGAFAADDEAIR